VINYATYRASTYNWMLGRFVVQSARLEEFVEAAGDLLPRDGNNRWQLAVTAGEDINETVKAVRDFNRAHSQRAIADVLEEKANTVS
jgi:hypothetical protein